jgi:hypothetical protein
MRGWYDNGPVFMNKRHVLLDDRQVRGNQRYRIVIYRFRCNSDGSFFAADRNPLLDKQTSKKRNRTEVTSHQFKLYRWNVAMLRNECADPTKCACLLHSIQSMVNNHPATGDTLFFTCISKCGQLPTMDPNHWECEHDTAKSAPRIEPKSFLAVPTEFHRGSCD